MESRMTISLALLDLIESTYGEKETEFERGIAYGLKIAQRIAACLEESGGLE